MINEKPMSGAAPTSLIYLLMGAVVMLLAYGALQSGQVESGLGLIAVLFVVTLFWTIMANVGFKTSKSQARLLLPLISAVVVLLAYGTLQSNHWEDSLGFAAVLFAAAMPALFWIKTGMPGVPVLPAVSVLYIVYFALAAVRGVGEQAGYTPTQVLTACLSVAVFLMVATLTNAALCARPPARRLSSARSGQISDRQVVRLIYAGLGLGLVFYTANLAGLLTSLGTLWSVARSVSMSAVALASFFLGYARARKILDRPNWLILCCAYLALMLLLLSSLFLASVMITSLVAIIGYVVTAKRIPWRVLAVAFLALSIFQAGKKEMRTQHWETHTNYNAQLSVSNAPAVVAQWFEVGTEALLSGTSSSSIVDRAALLNQLIRIEAWTPNLVPYLYGDTYTYLPYIIIPRFVLPDKPTSQIVMNKLDVRYGFLTPDETRYVAVGINLIPEGFANFGYFGIVLIGIGFGVITGFFTRLSMGRSAISLPTLLAIASFVTLMDLEADLSSLLTTMFQSLVSVSLFFALFRYVFARMFRPSSVLRSGALLRLRRPNEPLAPS